MRFWAFSAVLLLLGCSSTGVAPEKQSAERLTPVVRLHLAADLSETSGLAEHQGEIWSMNDGGNAAVLHHGRLSQVGGEFSQLSLSGADNFDWESMAQNQQGLFILDCGNNRGDRIWLQSYFFSWESLADSTAKAERTDFRFGDTDPRLARLNHDNDCEAAAWVEDSLWIFTKNWVNQQTRIYRLAANDLEAASEQVLSTFETLPVGGLITGADYNADYGQLVLLGYGKGIAMLQPFVWFVPVKNARPDWSGAQRYFLDRSGQWEAILWRGDHLLVTREDSVLGGAVLAEIPVPSNRLKRY